LSERAAQPPVRERVELVESERVVERGSAKTQWFVRVRDGWTRARQVPGALVQPLETGPGVVWEHRIELTLARGARLLCVRSHPNPVQRSPLAHLEASGVSRLRILRTFHHVTRGGLVVRDAPRRA
jgi:hypothetical protein